MEVGSGLLDGEDRATHDDDVVDARRDELTSDGRRHVGRDAGPRRQLVTRQPQPDDPARAEGEQIAVPSDDLTGPITDALEGTTGTDER